jgi:RHS repeat-associated protein
MRREWVSELALLFRARLIGLVTGRCAWLPALVVRRLRWIAVSVTLTIISAIARSWSQGTTVRLASSYAMPFGYTYRQHGAETGLMYFRARYYDPTTGEFTSPDPLGYVDGMILSKGYWD